MSKSLVRGGDVFGISTGERSKRSILVATRFDDDDGKAWLDGRDPGAAISLSVGCSVNPRPSLARATVAGSSRWMPRFLSESNAAPTEAVRLVDGAGLE
ncbi:MAG TPA: hypothetical protein VMK12_03295 [Anaeromyxobacteraceae bacterium]|nr:hypothetical protein [Anaeromyxobacteraceae bacterium]